jgi:hydroxylamine dehydrogenase
MRLALITGVTTALLIGAASALAAEEAPEEAPEEALGDLSDVQSIVVDRGVTEVGKECIECHKDVNPGIVSDWKDSRHGHVGVTCIDCHQVEKDAPTASQHESLEGTETYVSVLVSPKVCGRCHSVEREQFNASGHFRAYHQIIPKDDLHALVHRHEGRSLPELSDAPNEVGCMQCHGTQIKLDENGRPTPETWPNSGMGNIYPDGATGNCSACHTRHKFSIAEARKPYACASCHLGPDHPDIEVYENSKHGQIFDAEGHEWNWNTSPDAWEPGDYRAPTCATCHMSGIGELKTTHNITERLYWNLWAKESKVRNSNDVMSPILGNGPEGREKMREVCSACHGELHTDSFFEQGDKAVRLYNEGYWAPAKKMHDDLEAKGLLTENPWIDEFQITYYHLWHHQGRRARHGAMMAGPDWAHWHGFFELQQDLYKLEQIYKKRIETGKIEGVAL